MRLILVRHGRPDEGGAETPNDPPLSEDGRRQARAGARLLGSEGITRIIASPLRRARETAEPLAKGLGLPVEIIDLWAEADRGRVATDLRRRSALKGERPGRAFWPTRSPIWEAIRHLSGTAFLPRSARPSRKNRPPLASWSSPTASRSTSSSRTCSGSIASRNSSSATARSPASDISATGAMASPASTKPDTTDGRAEHANHASRRRGKSFRMGWKGRRRPAWSHPNFGERFQTRCAETNEHGRIYGGQILGQALYAASQSASRDRFASCLQLLFAAGGLPIRRSTSKLLSCRTASGSRRAMCAACRAEAASSATPAWLSPR